MSLIIVLGANEFNPKREIIIYAVVTGLSMILASLIVVLTITMAVDTKRMAPRNVIVRNLKSLEALGGVTSMSRRVPPSQVELVTNTRLDICSGKTGTLTQGTMIVKKVWFPGRGTYSVGATSGPFNPTQGNSASRMLSPRTSTSSIVAPKTTPMNSEEVVAWDSTLQEYLNVASLANLATVYQVEGEWHGRGNPTGIAIQVFTSRFNWNRLRIVTGEKPQWHEVAEFPFDSDVEMSVIFEKDQSQKQWVFTKGAVERAIFSCPRYAVSDEIKRLIPVVEQSVLRNMEAPPRLGLQVLALASRTDIRHVVDNEAELDRDLFETDLVFPRSYRPV